jgi:proteasome lid subunit RPN8/RPN11
MIESSRLFLFTEYARKGCGTIETHGTDYKVWEALPVGLCNLSTYSALLTLCRIASLPTRELRSFWFESRTTRSPKRRGSPRTTSVASHTARTSAIQRVCTPRNSANTCAMTPSPMERMELMARTVSKHRLPYILCYHSHVSGSLFRSFKDRMYIVSALYPVLRKEHILNACNSRHKRLCIHIPKLLPTPQVSCGARSSKHRVTSL